MRSLTTLFLSFTCIFVGLSITVMPAFCQIRLENADILRAPERYYNQQVKLSGKVISIQAEGSESMSGAYQFRDKSGTEITIQSDILPLMGKTYEVNAIVYQGADPKIPLIRETSRSEKQRKYIGYLLGGALIMCAVAIVFGGSGSAAQ